jgi:hypothetical protein
VLFFSDQSPKANLLVVDRDIMEVELAFSGLELSDVDVEVPDRISLELFQHDPP